METSRTARSRFPRHQDAWSWGSAPPSRMLKRLNYLTHRWIGIVLGLLVFVWFGSGIVLMYYLYPELTESQQLSLLQGYEPDATLIGVKRAVDLYAAQGGGQDSVASARLELWDGHLVYALTREHRGRSQDVARIDAHSGQVLTPISPETATRVAQAIVGPVAPVERVELLPRSAHYFMGDQLRWVCPGCLGRFDDSH